MDDDTLDGIDTEDLPELLERVARESDEALPLHPEYEGFCAHRRANINDGVRRLTCRDCGATLDPFDFLYRLASESHRFVQSRRQVERRLREVQARLDALLRQERNARARVERLRKRLQQ